MKYTRFLLPVIFILLHGCIYNKRHPVDFYYWKSNVSIGDVEKQYFEGSECEKLFIRFFDVDSEAGQIVPKAKITSFDANYLKAEYIPVIFITNRTFQTQSREDLTHLAENIARLIHEIKERNSIPESGEIQIDCDWTERTRSNYFFFLEELKKITRKDISCTIRLHQVKYKSRTGIPPVSNAYLMCYATSNPTEFTDKNSILDIALLKDYTKNIETYPLPFDIALPLYSWAVVINHLGKAKLINGVTEADLSDPSFKKIGETVYRVEDDVFFNGIYLNKGFKIRIEQITPDLLHEAKSYLNGKVKRPYHIVYYHLDQNFLERFTIPELK